MSKKTHRDAFAKLDALYAQLPTIACRGLRGESCGPIPLATLEADRLRRSHPTRLAPATRVDRARCIYLTPTERCSVYAVRPLIRRSMAVRRMSCPFGCVPSTWLTDHQFVELARAVEQIAGPLLTTGPHGTQPLGALYFALDTQTVTSDVAEHYAELTRTFRALHHGRVTSVTPSDADRFLSHDDLRRRDDDE